MKARIKISQGTKTTLYNERMVERRMERNKIKNNNNKNREMK